MSRDNRKIAIDTCAIDKVDGITLITLTPFERIEEII